ncbi:MAG: tetratricopeptide repeat protein [Candidatus Thiodiazotropha sp.]
MIRKALAESESGNLKEAQTLLNQAIALAPESALAYTRLGGIQLLQQEYAAGIGSFQKAIMLDQGNAEAFIGLSIAYLHQGRYSLAREALSEASRLRPDKQQTIDQVLAWLDQREQTYGR